MTLKDRQLTSFPLEELSWKITKHASVVSQYLAAHNLPQPSVGSDGPSTTVPVNAPVHIRRSLQDLLSASLEIFQLALGPSEFVPNLATGFQYASCISWLCQYNIFRLVPLDKAISYADLAATANVPEQRLKSIMRMAMTNSLFREQFEGKYAGHSATSAYLARNVDVHTWATYISSRTAPMALSLATAHQRWGPDTDRKNETAYNVAFNTNLPFFDHISEDEARVCEFAAYMRNVTSSKGTDLTHLVTGFAWDQIVDGGVVVDVGGSSGSAAIKLATTFPNINFVVQDMPANAQKGRVAASSLPANVASRLTFQGHDFTKAQPVQGAAVYLLRMILHDWPDKEAITILQQIVAAMDPASSRILIMDTVLPMPGSVPISAERIVRVRDLTMMQAFNSKERDLEDWEALMAAVDQRLRLVNVVQPFGSDMSVLEVKLDSTLD